MHFHNCYFINLDFLGKWHGPTKLLLLLPPTAYLHTWPRGGPGGIPYVGLQNPIPAELLPDPPYGVQLQ